jgi:hypothetical protein
MKFALIIVIPFLLLACQPKTPFELGPVTPVPVQQSYISLRENNGTLLKYGSAVIVAEGYAITSRHVIEGSNQMKGTMAGGIEFHIQEVILSESLDLALFRIPSGVGEPMKIGEKISVGEPVFGVGTSIGSAIYEGVVRKTDFLIHHIDIDLRNPSSRDSKGRPITLGFLCEGDFKKGFSGGPLVNRHGELVGIIQGYSTELYKNSDQIELKMNIAYGTAYHSKDVMDEVKRMMRPEGKGATLDSSNPLSGRPFSRQQ